MDGGFSSFFNDHSKFLLEESVFANSSAISAKRSNSDRKKEELMDFSNHERRKFKRTGAILQRSGKGFSST